MSNRKPVLVLTDNDQIRRMILAAANPRMQVAFVNTMSDVVLPPTKGQVSLVVVDLASRVISGDDLMAIARVAEGRDVPLLIMTRQPRHAVKALASVLNGRDVISTTESASMIGARLRLWIGLDAELETLPLGFSIVNSAAATAQA
jgi:CheY-like chemotaxis protein